MATSLSFISESGNRVKTSWRGRIVAGLVVVTMPVAGAPVVSASPATPAVMVLQEENHATLTPLFVVLTSLRGPLKCKRPSTFPWCR